MRFQEFNDSYCYSFAHRKWVKDVNIASLKSGG